MKRACWTVLAAVLVSFLSIGAFAQEALHPSKLDPTWKGLPFGGTRDQVLEVLSRRIQDRYGAMIRDTLDVRDRDRLSRDMQKEIGDVQSSHIVFDGAQTGWNVSILRDEFVPGMGIEMILVREGNARYFLFFKGGVFFKLVTTPQDPSRDTAITSLSFTYGKPSRVEYSDAKKIHVGLAEWDQAGPLVLSMNDFTKSFQTVMIRWALKTQDQAVRAELKKRAADGPALNPLIKEAQEAPEAEARDPADEMIGKPVDADKKPAGRGKTKRK
jgi:hypothetical protein